MTWNYRLWYEKNRIKILEKQRKRWTGGYIPGKIAMYRTNAKRLGLDFEIAEKAAWLMRQPCFYCGTPANPLNGIDRLDNAIGYTETNTVPCCKVCNWGKGDKLSSSEWIDHCSKVVGHWSPGEE